MATCNGAAYLSEQLQSLADQKRLPDELVVSDDCSSDETMNILQRFSKEAPFQVIVEQNQKNIGWTANFSKAMIHTSGDLVFLSDQDDVWLPEKIEYMAKLAGEYPDFLLLMNNAMLTDEEMNSTGYTKLGQIEAAGLGQERFVMGSCCAVRKKLIELCLPVAKEFSGHDMWLSYFAEHLSGRYVSEKVLQYYRRHSRNETNSISSTTDKIRLWHKMQHNLGKYLESMGNIERQERLIKKTEILTNGVLMAMNRDTGFYAEHLSELLSKLENKSEQLKMRKEIRESAFFQRTSLIFKNYNNDFYSDFSGVKSALRDLLG